MRQRYLSGGCVAVAGSILAVLCLGGLILLGFDMLVWKAGPKHTRSDCLVQLDIEYVHEPWIERQTVTMLVGGIGGRRYKEALPPGVLSNITTGGLDNDTPSIRLAFRKDCEDRFAMAQLIVDEFEHNHPGLVRFTISRDRLDPRLRNQCFSGPYWIDTDC